MTKAQGDSHYPQNSGRVSAVSVRQLIARPLIWPLIFLGLMVMGVIYAVDRNAMLSAKVETAQQRQTIISALVASVNALETGQRGYLLTQDPTFLDPYLDAHEHFQNKIQELHALLASERQGHNLKRVEEAVTTWLNSYAEPEIRARRESLQEALRMVQQGSSKEQMDEARAVLATMAANEGIRLTDTLAASTRTLAWLRLLSIGGFILSVIFLVLSIRSVTRTVSNIVQDFTEDTQRIAAGEYTLKAKATGVSELETLARQVQAMAQAVQQREAALQTSAQSLEQVNANLQRSNRELERFAYVASHDLQEPLRTIGSYTELLAKRYEGRLDERADQYIHFTISATHRLKNLIQDLLAFSRVHRSQRPFAEVDTAELCQQVLQELAVKQQNAKARVQVGPLPTVIGNRELLHHIFLNLIANAIKFRSPERQPLVQVRAERLTDQAGWRFEVQDNGIGIEAQYHDKIFGVFERLHGIGEYEGSGIGLAVTRSAIEQHGGQIGLTSIPGQGSTFSFTLPDRPPVENHESSSVQS